MWRQDFDNFDDNLTNRFFIIKNETNSFNKRFAAI